MSGQTTPISKVLSSLNTPRVFVQVQINSDLPGLKTMLVQYFSGAKLFAKIQRSDTGITKATVQGHPNQFPSSLEYLSGLLKIMYDATLVWGEMSPVAEEGRYNSITVEETLPNLKRDPSSGEFLEQELDEISFGGSAATEALKKIAKETFATMTNAATDYAIANKLMPTIQAKHITLKRGSEEFDLEVSTISSLSALLEAVQKKYPQAPQITKLYRLREETAVVVTDVNDLREGFLYYVLAGFEVPPNTQNAQFTTMDEFFDRLSNDQVMSDAQVETAREICFAQGITFKQLMATGDLALTDGKLEKIGITQLGLRTAILSVIKSNQ